LDSDDLWHPEKLALQVAFMEENGYHFSYTRYSEINEESQPLGRMVTGPRKITKRGMYRYCWPGCLTVMYEASEIGLIQIADLKKNNDYAMWLQVCKKADCYLLPKELAQYRRGRRGSVSSMSYVKLIKWHYRLFRRADGRSPLTAACFTLRNLFFGFCKKQFFVKWH
jgi:hypothetical protein